MGLFGKKESKIVAQQTGKAVPITEVPDPVFSDKVLGDGIATVSYTHLDVYKRQRAKLPLLRASLTL